MISEYGSNFELSEAKGDGTCLVDTDKVLFLRTAREALYYICQHVEAKSVLMPALCCTSMVQPFVQAGMEVSYYKISSDLSIDLLDLRKKLGNNVIVLVMHYYGTRSYSNKMLQLELEPYDNVTIVQDCTQHVFTNNLFDGIADYWIGSIRKWASIADGAFIASKKHSLTKQGVVSFDDGFVQKTYQAMVWKKEYLQSRDKTLKNKYRKYFGECMIHLKEPITIHSMSNLSRELFYRNVNCLNVKEKRYENYNVLRKGIEKYFPDTLQFATEQDSPLCLNVVLEDRDMIQKELAKLGIYCQVLWPLSEESQCICEFSNWYAKHMLAIPCDQRYTVEEMQYIVESFLNILGKGVTHEAVKWN